MLLRWCEGIFLCWYGICVCTRSDYVHSNHVSRHVLIVKDSLSVNVSYSIILQFSELTQSHVTLVVYIVHDLNRWE
jgi:hypothetical protein